MEFLDFGAEGIHFKTECCGAVLLIPSDKQSLGPRVDNHGGGILLLRSEEQNSDPRRGHNKEEILLTVHGFKQLCMAANTDKARRVRDYYISMLYGPS
jgi:hypothetical protein